MIVTFSSLSSFMAAENSGMSEGSGFSVGSVHEMSKLYEGNLAFVTAFSVAFGVSVGTEPNISQFANFNTAVANTI
ncbi:hypothetical protein IY804_05665, partial [Campylobacter volucris]|nr:hypothetical protein [Campylobacter volucris]